jgi:hypothetical protein
MKSHMKLQISMRKLQPNSFQMQKTKTELYKFSRKFAFCFVILIFDLSVLNCVWDFAVGI